MIHIVIGALLVASLWMLVEYARRRNMPIKGWQWLLTVLGVVYAAFVLEVIFGFIAEDAAMAAVVMGLVLGLVAIIWGVLLGRFVFKAAS